MSVPTTRRRVVRLIGFAVSVVCVVALAIVLGRRPDALSAAWDSMRAAPAWALLTLLAAPFLSWVATSLMFWLHTRRFGLVRFTEMLALIAAAAMLNFLPMRPGMVGRIAYHKRVNKITIVDSSRVVFASLVTTGAALLVLIGVGTLGSAGGVDSIAHWALWFSAPIVVTALLGLVIAATAVRRSRAPLAAWLWGFAGRYADSLTWVARYLAVFEVVGAPLTVQEAVAVTVISHGAMLTPAPIGLREWAVGMTAGWQAAQGGADLTDALAPGLIADTIVRLSEAVLGVFIGIPAIGWMSRKMARVPDATEEPEASERSRSNGGGTKHSRRRSGAGP